MEAELGNNLIPLLGLLPVWVIVAAVIGWMVLKMGTSLWRRVMLVGGGVLALLGLAVLLVGVYYQVSPEFADTFKFYAYSALAPGGDPFKDTGNTQTVLIAAEVQVADGSVQLYRHPDPESPTIVTVFVPNRFIGVDLKGDTLTIPATEAGSLPRSIDTSLWWALTKNINSVVSEVED